MMDILEQAGAAGGGAAIVAAALFKLITVRFDRIDSSVEAVVDKLDRLDGKVRDHEVRIQVLEKLEERDSRD